MRCFPVIVTFLGILCCASARSQDVPDAPSPTGLPPTNSYDSSPFDTINLNTGQVTTRNKLFSLPQKGRLKLSYSVPVSDIPWTIVSYDFPDTVDIIQSVMPANSPISGSTSGYIFPFSQIYAGFSAGPFPTPRWRDQAVGIAYNSILFEEGGYPSTINWPISIDSMFTQHVLLDDAQHVGVYRATDGSGYSFIGSALGQPSGTLLSPNGISTALSSQYNPDNLTTTLTSVETDPNPSQNSIRTVFTEVGENAPTFTVQDSMERTFNEPTGAPDGPTPSARCPILNAPNQPLIGSESWNVPGPNGGTST